MPIEEPSRESPFRHVPQSALQSAAVPKKGNEGCLGCTTTTWRGGVDNLCNDQMGFSFDFGPFLGHRCVQVTSRRTGSYRSRKIERICHTMTTMCSEFQHLLVCTSPQPLSTEVGTIMPFFMEFHQQQNHRETRQSWPRFQAAKGTCVMKFVTSTRVALQAQPKANFRVHLHMVWHSNATSILWGNRCLPVYGSSRLLRIEP